MKKFFSPSLNFIRNSFSAATQDWHPIWMIRHIDVEPVAVCNLRCGFCQVPGWNRATETKAMGLEEFKKLIGHFPRLKHIKLQGMGEPFLNKQLPEMVAYATSKGIRSSITSNATLLNDDVNRRIFSAGLKTMVFSFDGATPKTYEAARLGARFDSVCANIKLFCEMKNEMKARTSIEMACLVSNPEILKEIPDHVLLAKELGIEHFHVKGRLKAWKKLATKGQYRFESSYINEQDAYAEVIREAKKRAKKVEIKFSVGDSESAQFNQSNPCPWSWTSLYVSTEGRVVPCCTIGNPDTWDMGDLKEKSLDAIWNSKEYRDLRKSIRTNTPREICQACYQLSP